MRDIRLAHNPNNPSTALALLASDIVQSVRTRVATNRNASPDVLVKLLDDPHRDVRTAARIAATQHTRPIRFSEFSWFLGGLKIHWRRK